MNTNEKYIVISKNNVPEPHMPKDWAGRDVLVSFASIPLWKSFRYLYLQKERLPKWDKEISTYALKKYANKKDFEIMTYNEALILFNNFKKENKLR